MKRDPLERLLRDRLTDHEPTIDGEAAWADFERLRMPPPRRRRRGGWWWLAGLGLLLLPLLGYFGYRALAEAGPKPITQNPGTIQPTASAAQSASDNHVPQLILDSPDPGTAPAGTDYPAIPTTNSSTITPADLPRRAAPALPGAGAVGRLAVQVRTAAAPVVPAGNSRDDRVAIPTVSTIDLLPASEVYIELSFPSLLPAPQQRNEHLKPPPFTKRARRRHWEFGFGQGYGLQRQRYVTRQDNAALKDLRSAVEQGLDVWQSDAFLRARFKSGWFLQTGLYVTRAETRSYQLVEKTELVALPNTVIERIREPDGSFTTITATVNGERYRRTEKRIHYQDLRLGWQLGFGRHFRAGRHAFDASLLGVYQPTIRFKGNVIDAGGNFRAVSPETRPGYHAAAQLDYHLPRLGDMQPRIGLFAGRDLRTQRLSGLALRRSTAGVRLSMQW